MYIKPHPEYFLRYWFIVFFVYGPHWESTYNLLLVVGATAVGGGEGRGALLEVPGLAAVLRGTADGESINTVGVAVTVTAVEGTSSVP